MFYEYKRFKTESFLGNCCILEKEISSKCYSLKGLLIIPSNDMGECLITKTTHVVGTNKQTQQIYKK